MRARAEFMGKYIMYCRSLVRGTEVTGEDITRGCESKGIFPHDPHAWGRACSEAIKLGILRDTRRNAQMAKRTSHARKTTIYRVT